MIKLVSSKELTLEDISLEVADRKNRKKSSNMILSEKIINSFLEEFTINEYDLIICTGEGELEQTYSFFSSLASKDHARPIFFQNSLHNSTLGSVSLQVPNIHLGISASNGFISFETGLEMAISSDSLKPVIILGVDAYPKDLIELKEKNYDGTVKLKTGACGALFLRDKNSDLYRETHGQVLKDLLFSSHELKQNYNSAYPSDGLLEILNELSIGKTNFTINRPSGDSIEYFFES